MLQARTDAALLRALHPGPLTSELPLDPQGSVIGREYGQADILALGPGVSRRHCRLRRDEHGNWQISDLDSTNGVFINGHRIAGEVLLQPGDVIGLGQVRGADFEFMLATDSHASRRLSVAGPGPWLIGRDLAHPLSLPADPGVSLDHARVLALPGGLFIEDLGSRNGTWVDGRRVRRAPLTPQSVVVIGSNELRLRESGNGDNGRPVFIVTACQQAIGLSAQGLKLDRHDERTMSFSIRSGCLQVLTVPDANRRVVLIGVLNGTQRGAGGRVDFSESEIGLQPERRRDRIGVLSADTLAPRQSILSGLEDLTALTLAADVSDANRRELATTSLAALGLTDLADRCYQELDPLQQCLVLIAAAILTRPGLLIVDHPDHLDATDSSILLDQLRRLAGRSMTVLVLAGTALEGIVDDEQVRTHTTEAGPTAVTAAPRRPHQRRASTAATRVLVRRSILGWVDRPASLIEALALPLLLVPALWVVMPEGQPALIAVLTVAIAAALAAAFQPGRWQPGLLRLAARNLLVNDILIAMLVSGFLIALVQSALVTGLVYILPFDQPGSVALGLALPFVALSATALGLMCGLVTRTRPVLALALVCLALVGQILGAVLVESLASPGLLMRRLADLSAVYWGLDLVEQFSESAGPIRPLAFLAGQALLFLAMARAVLRRSNYSST